jgi:hypothetical protein
MTKRPDKLARFPQPPTQREREVLAADKQRLEGIERRVTA